MPARLRMRRRRGASFIDWLLVASLAALAVVVAAYVWMPDVRRGLATLIDRAEADFGLE